MEHSSIFRSAREGRSFGCRISTNCCSIAEVTRSRQCQVALGFAAVCYDIHHSWKVFGGTLLARVVFGRRSINTLLAKRRVTEIPTTLEFASDFALHDRLRPFFVRW
jgi:hypothetical protein